MAIQSACMSKLTLTQLVSLPLAEDMYAKQRLGSGFPRRTCKQKRDFGAKSGEAPKFAGNPSRRPSGSTEVAPRPSANFWEKKRW